MEEEELKESSRMRLSISGNDVKRTNAPATSSERRNTRTEQHKDTTKSTRDVFSASQNKQKSDNALCNDCNGPEEPGALLATSASIQKPSEREHAVSKIALEASRASFAPPRCSTLSSSSLISPSSCSSSVTLEEETRVTVDEPIKKRRRLSMGRGRDSKNARNDQADYRPRRKRKNSGPLRRVGGKQSIFAPFKPPRQIRPFTNSDRFKDRCHRSRATDGRYFLPRRPRPAPAVATLSAIEAAATDNTSNTAHVQGDTTMNENERLNSPGNGNDRAALLTEFVNERAPWGVLATPPPKSSRLPACSTTTDQITQKGIKPSNVSITSTSNDSTNVSKYGCKEAPLSPRSQRDESVDEHDHDDVFGDFDSEALSEVCSHTITTESLLFMHHLCCNYPSIESPDMSYLIYHLCHVIFPFCSCFKT